MDWTAPALIVTAALAAGCSLDRLAVSARDSGGESDSGVELDAGPAQDAGPDAQIPDGDGGVPWRVDVTTAGVFRRASEASYLIEAPSRDGAFLVWAPPDVRRLEDRGDGAGPLLLLEGARTNVVVDSRESGAPSWSLAGGITPMSNVAPGPDGSTRAERYLAAAGFSQGQRTPTSSSPHTLSVWGRAFDTTSVWTASYAYPTQPSGAAWYVPDQDGVWTRRASTVVPSAQGHYHPIDLTIGAGDLDLILDLHQVESGTFPTSAIRTGASPVARSADELVLSADGVTAGVLAVRTGFAEVSPIFASADVAPASEMWLLSFGDDDGVRFRHDGSMLVAEVVAAGRVRARSGPLRFARHALLGSVCWDPAAGTVTVGGVVGPAGEVWEWPAPTSIRIGGLASGAGEAFARIGSIGPC